MKILVVDDEALIRNVVKEYLEAEHFKVDEAGDGDEAIKLVNNKDYDLIVLDIMMPKNGLVLNISGRRVEIDGERITMTPKEYDLLKCFLMNHHIALSREQLLTNIWGYDFYGDDRTVDTHVKTLRQHLGKYGKYVKTIRKVGYKFEYED